MTSGEMEARAVARVFAEGMRVYRVVGDEHRFVSPSSSEPGMAYEVRYDPASEDLACNCPGARYRGVCKHSRAVALLMLAEAQGEKGGASGEAG